MRKKIEEFERAVESKTSATWKLTTDDDLAAVLRPGYFAARFPDRQVRRHDKIEVIASQGDDAAEYANLVVVTGGKDVTVAQLTGGLLLP
jgi:hypothetical protein